MYIKLDGENIISHIDERHPGVNAADWDAKVDKYKLVDDEGSYIYKYIGGELVELDESEINDHPLKTEKEAEGKFSQVRELILSRMALIEVRDHAQTPQNIKDRASSKLQKVNQQLVEILGL